MKSCPECGAVTKSDPVVTKEFVPKKTFEYMLLCLVGGAFGIHHLYLGKKDEAMKYFWVSVAGLICLAGLPTVICWVLAIIDLMKADKVVDAQGHPLV